jgi:hypothetical protein
VCWGRGKQVVCKIDALTPSQAKDFKSKIDDEYRVNMILDNLPVGMVKIREENGAPVKTYERGYPVGFKAAIEEGGEQKHFLHNHLRFAILYHKDVETDLARIVGFEVRTVTYSLAVWLPGQLCTTHSYTSHQRKRLCRQHVRQHVLGECANTHDASVATAAQVEPFSVKHEYEAPWDPVKPSLETCHPGRMQYVTHGLAPQVRVTDVSYRTLQRRRRPSPLHLLVECHSSGIIPPALFASLSAPNSCIMHRARCHPNYSELASSHIRTQARSL